MVQITLKDYARTSDLSKLMSFSRLHSLQLGWVMNKVEALYNANLANDLDEALDLISNILEEER